MAQNIDNDGANLIAAMRACSLAFATSRFECVEMKEAAN
jgi:hypothetical protein